MKISRNQFVNGCVPRGLVVALTFGGFALAADAQTTVPSDPQLPADIRFVLEQCKTTFDRVKDVTYTFEYHYTGAQKKVDRVGSAKQSGSLDSEQVQDVTTFFEGGKPSYLTASAYIAPQECGDWPHSAMFPLQCLYPDRNSMSDRAKAESDRFRAPHPELYAFGDGRIYLWNPSHFEPSHLFLWKLLQVQSGNQTWLHLQGYYQRPDGSFTDKPGLLFVIDPSKGYEVDHFESRLLNGRLVWQDDTTLAEVSGHRTLWYPQKVFERYYGAGLLSSLGDNTPPKWTELTTFDHVVVDAKFPKDDFTLAALQMPKGHPFLQIDPEGKQRQLTWTGDRAVVVNESQSVVPVPPRQPIAEDAKADAESSSGISGVQVGLFLAVLASGLFLLIAAAILSRRPGGK